MAHRSRASKQSESGFREPKLKILWNFYKKSKKVNFFEFFFDFFWWIMMEIDGFGGENQNLIFFVNFCKMMENIIFSGLHNF